jgi:hypothetical protein
VPERSGSSRVSVGLNSGIIGSVLVAVSAGPILGDMAFLWIQTKQPENRPIRLCWRVRVAETLMLSPHGFGNAGVFAPRLRQRWCFQLMVSVMHVFLSYGFEFIYHP